jgi:chaperonin cofactor prefoldin
VKSWDKYKAESQEPSKDEVIADLRDKLETAERRIRELEAKIESLQNEWERDAL